MGTMLASRSGFGTGGRRVLAIRVPFQVEIAANLVSGRAAACSSALSEVAC